MKQFNLMITQMKFILCRWQQYTSNNPAAWLIVALSAISGLLYDAASKKDVSCASFLLA
jgi:hypothetical protein